MLRGMTLRQLGEWRAYADLEPFDEERADLRAASIVQAIYNVHGRKKGQPKFKLEDCVLHFGAQRMAPKAQSRADAQAQVMSTMAVLMTIYNEPPRKRPKV